MSNELPKCGTCRYWHYRPDVQAVANAANNVLAANDLQGGVGVGDCTGFPPEVHIIPFRTLKGDGIGPQSFDRQTLSIRPCCHLHQDAPLSNAVQAHMDRSSGYLDAQEIVDKALAEGLADALPIALHYPGDKDSN